MKVNLERGMGMALLNFCVGIFTHFFKFPNNFEICGITENHINRNT